MAAPGFARLLVDRRAVDRLRPVARFLVPVEGLSQRTPHTCGRGNHVVGVGAQLVHQAFHVAGVAVVEGSEPDRAAARHQPAPGVAFGPRRLPAFGQVAQRVDGQVAVDRHGLDGVAQQVAHAERRADRHAHGQGLLELAGRLGEWVIGPHVMQRRERVQHQRIVHEVVTLLAVEHGPHAPALGLAHARGNAQLFRLLQRALRCQVLHAGGKEVRPVGYGVRHQVAQLVGATLEALVGVLAHQAADLAGAHRAGRIVLHDAVERNVELAFPQFASAGINQARLLGHVQN
ncbi:hypothetical protein D3C87_1292390 [compost metagenome]